MRKSVSSSYTRELEFTQETLSTMAKNLLVFVMLSSVAVVSLGAPSPEQSSSTLRSSTATPRPAHLFNSEEEQNDDDESYESYEYYYDDEECPPSKFWHIRGRRCVPFRCPKGNSLRDWKTGECLFDEEENSKSVSSGRPVGAFARTAYLNRKVLRPQRVYVGRGRSVTRWTAVPKKVKVQLEENQANPTRSWSLVG